MQVTDAMVAKALEVWTDHDSINDDEAMRAALTAALAAMWRPMVEAPVDDTQILAATDDGRVMIFSGEILFRIGLENQPTHLQFPAIAWMPIPSPPKKEA